MPKWKRYTVRNGWRFELLAKILEENNLRFPATFYHTSSQLNLKLVYCELDNNLEKLHHGISGL